MAHCSCSSREAVLDEVVDCSRVQPTAAQEAETKTCNLVAVTQLCVSVSADTLRGERVWLYGVLML